MLSLSSSEPTGSAVSASPPQGASSSEGAVSPHNRERQERQRSGRRVVLRWLGVVGTISALAMLLLILAGFFHPKVAVPPGNGETEERKNDGQVIPAERIATVRLVRRPRWESAVGTVRPVHEAAVASKLLAKVVEVRVRAGQAVQKGEVLVRLDDADLQARKKQAEAALQSAHSLVQQTQADYERAAQLLRSNSIARSEFDKAEAAWRAAQAERERLQQLLREAEVLLDYTIIRSPIDGIVIDKRVEIGDTVTPGQVVLTVYDPTRMQLVATVRESLAQRLRVGQKIRGRLETLDYECEATVSEIVPEAQAASRSFTVKVVGPCPPGVYSGMFGRIFLPLEEEEVLVIPPAAVRHIGQLTLVDVLSAGRVVRRSVLLGRQLPEGYEVLSGLREGEQVVLPDSQKETRS
jgi:membrane fusion protein (multidrug efflux system)